MQSLCTRVVVFAELAQVSTCGRIFRLDKFLKRLIALRRQMSFHPFVDRMDNFMPRQEKYENKKQIWEASS
ncbi:hypothetical protein [Ensifer aridi]|uniref:hypothetical protein n=1 Tax=Ensifer aridi TaxID=1708715 RepID=UPI00040AA220|nr:hypothetical protein [Ensifer aridi]